MANATPDRVGQINGSGAVDALFLKVFAGEVLTAWSNTTVTMGRHTVRQISSGKSAQFPRTGRVTASYHVPGNEILGQSMNHAEAIISINDLLIAPVFVANLDEAMNHFDMRSTYSTEIGGALARQMDSHVLQANVLAARATNVVTGLPGGTIITLASAGDELIGTKLATALFSAAQKLDENNAPEDGRFCYFRPAQYYSLVQSKDAINRDWGGAGAYSDGKVFRVAGIEIVKTNQLPSTNVTTGTVGAGTADRFLGNYTKTVGLVTHQSAVGTVKLLDLGLESQYDIRRQGTLMVGKYAVGHGILRPEAAVEIAAA